MGFPAACSEMPRLLLNLFFLLDHLRRICSWLLRLVGAGIDDDLSFDYSHTSEYFPDHRSHQEQQYQHYDGLEELEEHSPAMRFDALPISHGEDGARLLLEDCAVCLGDFHGAAWVRRPRGCRHVFHRGCLDRWAAHGHRTCPLCRAPLLPSRTTALVLLPLPLPAS